MLPLFTFRLAKVMILLSRILVVRFWICNSFSSCINRLVQAATILYSSHFLSTILE
ncbi:hypothetical protein SAMN04488087_1908 [Rhodothermus profundi]|uniref:Uncharacterized protein n=1 Tax=Rhodothermus profundi TaxID=633813 RepID=A0A1M6V5U5_9BACT|nr:hypothetical protein SAMN04488087_1908 [Rhodothermus profundi]